MQWFLLNIALFFLPGLCGLLGILIFGNQLGLFAHESPLALAYTLAYFMIFAGSETVFTGVLTQLYHKPLLNFISLSDLPPRLSISFNSFLYIGPTPPSITFFFHVIS